MKAGVFKAKRKDGSVYFRSNITYLRKHISLGSFETEDAADADERCASEASRDAFFNRRDREGPR